MAFAMLWEKKWKHTGVIVSILLLIWGFSAIVPKGSAISSIDVAIIQGGGEQGTRAINTNEREVLSDMLRRLG